MNSFLSLGTIIKQENASLMIIGYLPMLNEKVYAYSAVPYPTGLLDNGEIVVISGEADFTVVQEGYSDQKIESFAKSSCDIYNKMTNKSKPKDQG